ncbi:MAG: hypothetical protein K2L02_01920, partial [Clostridia bacterium]|nr:hypothetical protein [Clostridia bacterium]
MKKIIAKSKFILIGLVVFLILIGCYLLKHIGINAWADSAYLEGQLQDKEILQYYHEPSIEESFEDNKINVILKSKYSNLDKIGFDDFKVIENISKISSISYNL